MKINKYTALILVLLFTGVLNAQLTRTIVSLSGVVYDATTKKPISVNVEIYDQDMKRVNKVKSNSNDGSYFITGLKPGQSYEIRVAEFEYMRQSFPVTFPKTDRYAEFSRDITLLPKKVATKLAIPFKAFEVNKSKLKAGVDVLLKDYTELLKNNPTVRVKLVCYPDAAVDAAKNMELTKARAESLKSYFESNGLGADRFIVEGVSTIDPNNPPPTGKASKGKRYVGNCYIVIDSF